MEEARPAPDAAAEDPERSWGNGRVFRCTSCDESFRIVQPNDVAPGQTE